MYRRYLFFCIFSLIFVKCLNTPQPLRYAEDYLTNYWAKLGYLDYGYQCANPVLIKEYGEYMLKNPSLTYDMANDSAIKYNLWKENGGYICNPTFLQCKIEDELKVNKDRWICGCPENIDVKENGGNDWDGSLESYGIGFIGNQKIKTILKADGKFDYCQYEPNKFYIDSSKISGYPYLPLPSKNQGNVLNQRDVVNCELLPKNYFEEQKSSYVNAIVCGFYYEETYTNVGNNKTTYTLASGLHYNNVRCPNNQKCLMLEFNVECSLGNIRYLINTWLGENDRANRLVNWPPCTCVDSSIKTEKEISKHDKTETKVKNLFKDLPKVGYDKNCDNSKYTNLKKCLRDNWYLYPEGIYKDFKAIYDLFVIGTIGPVCQNLKGLYCNPKGKCSCGETPDLPGYSPKFPVEINKDGYCLLDTNSDCHYNYTEIRSERSFKCKDSELCLIETYNYECSKENLEYARNATLKTLLTPDSNANELDLQLQFLARCRCTEGSKMKSFIKNDGTLNCKISFNLYLLMIVIIGKNLMKQ